MTFPVPNPIPSAVLATFGLFPRRALKSLFPSALTTLRRVLAPAEHSDRFEEMEESNELWRIVLNLPFMRHDRDFSAWRVERRHPQAGEYVLAMRNGPETEESRQNRRGGLWSRGARPGYVIGYNGLIVTTAKITITIKTVATISSPCWASVAMTPAVSSASWCLRLPI